MRFKQWQEHQFYPSNNVKKFHLLSPRHLESSNWWDTSYIWNPNCRFYRPSIATHREWIERCWVTINSFVKSFCYIIKLCLFSLAFYYIWKVVCFFGYLQLCPFSIIFCYKLHDPLNSFGPCSSTWPAEGHQIFYEEIFQIWQVSGYVTHLNYINNRHIYYPCTPFFTALAIMCYT